MPQAQTPKPEPHEPKVRLRITLTLSRKLYEKMKQYMEENNYLSVPELLRDLLREKLGDGDE